MTANITSKTIIFSAFRPKLYQNLNPKEDSRRIANTPNTTFQTRLKFSRKVINWILMVSWVKIQIGLKGSLKWILLNLISQAFRSYKTILIDSLELLRFLHGTKQLKAQGSEVIAITNLSCQHRKKSVVDPAPVRSKKKRR